MRFIKAIVKMVGSITLYGILRKIRRPDTPWLMDVIEWSTGVHTLVFCLLAIGFVFTSDIYSPSITLGSWILGAFFLIPTAVFYTIPTIYEISKAIIRGLIEWFKDCYDAEPKKVKSSGIDNFQNLIDNIESKIKAGIITNQLLIEQIRACTSEGEREELQEIFNRNKELLEFYTQQIFQLKQQYEELRVRDSVSKNINTIINTMQNTDKSSLQDEITRSIEILHKEVISKEGHIQAAFDLRKMTQ